MATLGKTTVAMKRAYLANRELNASLAKSVWGAVAVAIGLVVGALIDYVRKTSDAIKQQRALAAERKKFQQESIDISKAAEEYQTKEISSLKFLYKAAMDESLAKEERIKAAQKLINLYPAQFGNMSTEQIMLGKAQKAYDDLTASIILNARAKAAADKVMENEKKILDLKDELTENRAAYTEASEAKRLKDARNRAKRDSEQQSATTMTGALAMSQGVTSEVYKQESTAEEIAKMRESGANIRRNKGDIATLEKSNNKLTEEFKNNETFRKQMGAGAGSAGIGSADDDDFSTPGSLGLSDKERKKMEAEARRAAIKARKEFKAELDTIKAERDNSLASLMAERATGDIDYLQYQQEKYDAEKKFYDDSISLYEKWNLKEDDDHAALLKKRAEREAEWTKEKISLNKDAIQRIAAEEERELNYEYSKDPDNTLADEIAHQEELLAIRLNALEMERDLYDKGAREYEEMQRKIDDLLFADKEAKQKMLVQRVAEFQKQFDKLTVKEQYDLNISALHSLRKEEMISEEQFQKWKKALEKQYAKDSEAEKRQLPGNSPDTAKYRASQARKNFNSQKDSLDKALADKVIDADEYAVRLQRIKNEMNEALIDPLKTAQSEWVQMLTSAYDAWTNFANALKDPDADPFTAIANGITATAAIVNAVMQQITEFSNAEYEIQSKAVEKRYDREIKFAEGNAYLTKKLEKEKQDELNRLKAEQSKKDFQMQVIATIAQTAANAVQAYSAGLSIGGPAGLIMAPIAAALAVAQGAVQIALLKKQQQAAAAVGYSEGGFTRPGRKDEPAGIVHAGEWVASQKLVNNPKTRPMIEFLEHAQRSNRIGSITMEDVSRSVAAPMFNAFAPAQVQPVIVQQSAPAPASVSDPELSQSIARLNSRLERPFVTVNSVTGEGGIREAERKYDRMIRNKSRKQRS